MSKTAPASTLQQHGKQHELAGCSWLTAQPTEHPWRRTAGMPAWQLRADSAARNSAHFMFCTASSALLYLCRRRDSVTSR